MKIQTAAFCCSPNLGEHSDLLTWFTVALQDLLVSVDKNADLIVLTAPEFFLAAYDDKTRQYKPANDGFPKKVHDVCQTFTEKVNNLVIIPGTQLADAGSNTVYNRAAVWYRGAVVGTAYKKFAPKAEMKTRPRLVNGTAWPSELEPLVDSDSESWRKIALKHPHEFADDLDIFSIAGVQIGIEICNDVGFMKSVLTKTEASIEKWPDLFVMPSGGMSSGSVYITNADTYVDRFGEDLTGWFGNPPSVDFGKTIFGEMALRPGAVLLQCDGPVSVCGLVNKKADALAAYKPSKVWAFTEKGKSRSGGQQPVALHVFPVIAVDIPER